MNPTRDLLRLLFKQVGETVFYGPGYVCSEDLENGLDEFAGRSGPFDLVVATAEHVAFTSVVEERSLLSKRYSRFYPLMFPKRDLHYFPDIMKEFVNLAAPKIFTTLETDYYCLTEESLATIRNVNASVIGWGTEFTSPLHALPDYRKEAFCEKANDHWNDFVTQYAERIISLPAFVAETEFSWRPLEGRPCSWSVMGARYRSRKLARSALEEGGIDWAGKTLLWGLGVLNRGGLKPLRYSAGIALANHWFKNAIEGSRYSYTCGSGLRYPVRKFFEIPALGAVLVCEPCLGFEALGFEDGVNAVVCQPENVLAVHRELESDGSRAQAIAAAGRDLIWRTHSLHARIEQLRTALESILAGRFRGSRWCSGAFQLIEKNAG